MEELDKELDIVPVPKDFITAPMFASKPQTGTREVRVNGGIYNIDGKKVAVKGRSYTIGGFKPISHDGPTSPALDIRHGRALFVICSFWDKNIENLKVNFSLNEFCMRYANTNGGRYSREVKSILSDLAHCWIKVKEDGSKQWEIFRLLEHIRIHGKERRKKPHNNEAVQEEIWFDAVELDPKFTEMLKDLSKFARINLKTLRSIRSPLAQSIYAYIPSRAVHYSEENPFEINLKTLLTQLSHDVPSRIGLRKKYFVQNNNAVLKQLDGAKIVNGVLRVKLAKTTDEEDYKLQCWVEDKTKILKSEGVLKELWISSGGSIEEFIIRSKHPLPELSPYQIELMEKSNVLLRSNQIFFRMSLGLLRPSKFEEILSEAKEAVLKNIKTTKTPTHRVIHYIKEAIRETARNRGSLSRIGVNMSDIKKSEKDLKSSIEKHNLTLKNSEQKEKEDSFKRAKIFLEIFSEEFQEFSQLPLLQDDREYFVDPLLKENPKISKRVANYIIGNFFKASSEKLNKYNEQTVYLW